MREGNYVHLVRQGDLRSGDRKPQAKKSRPREENAPKPITWGSSKFHYFFNGGIFSAYRGKMITGSGSPLLSDTELYSGGSLRSRLHEIELISEPGERLPVQERSSASMFAVPFGYSDRWLAGWAIIGGEERRSDGNSCIFASSDMVEVDDVPLGGSLTVGDVTIPVGVVKYSSDQYKPIGMSVVAKSVFPPAMMSSRPKAGPFEARDKDGKLSARGYASDVAWVSDSGGHFVIMEASIVLDERSVRKERRGDAERYNYDMRYNIADELMRSLVLGKGFGSADDSSKIVLNDPLR